MMIKLRKELEGKTIYGWPTGNNARTYGGKELELVEFKVVKVYRKHIGLDNGYGEVKRCAETGADEQSIRSDYVCNAGYIFFETLQDFKEYNELKELTSIIYSRFDRWIRWLSRQLESSTPNAAIRELIEKMEQLYTGEGFTTDESVLISLDGAISDLNKLLEGDNNENR